MSFFKYKSVILLLVARTLALVALPFENENIVLTLRLTSFIIMMFVVVKLTSAKKKLKK